jgi:transglutaminase-like putative cysteine protease
VDRPALDASGLAADGGGTAARASRRGVPVGLFARDHPTGIRHQGRRSQAAAPLKTSLARPKDARALRTAVALATTRLAAQDASMHAEFARTREILKKVASKDKDKLQENFERTYRAKMGKLRDGLAGIASEPDDRRATKLAASLGGWLTAQDPKPKSQPLGTELPHRVVDYKAGPPVLGTSIAPAYAPNTPGAEPSPLPKTPTPEDTTQTIEVRFTPEIRSLAASLGNEPVKMYEYVRNTIDFEPYYGSRKGAAETLAEGSGNDMDTASLLIALYRVSGIPARYVQGVVDVPIDKAMNWVGVETPEAAAKLFSAGGVPSALITSGGKPKWLRIEHCWAEVFVPYEDYRGAGASTGRQWWVPQDPSLKGYLNRASMTAVRFVSATDRSLLGTALDAAMTTDTDSIVRFDIESVAGVLGAVASRTAEAMAADQTSQDMTSAIGCRRIDQVRLAVCASALPFPSTTITGEFAAVPDALQSRVLVSVLGASGQSGILDFDDAAASIGSRRLVLRFEPASPADAEILRASTSIEQLPAYLVAMRPVLQVDGAVVSRGSSAQQLGEREFLRIRGTGAARTLEGDTAITVGGCYAVAINMGRIAWKPLSSSLDAFRSQIASLQVASQRPGVSEVDVDALLGGFFHVAGLWYFSVLDAYDSNLARARNIAWYRLPSLAVAGTEFDPTTLFEVPVAVRLLGAFMDVTSDTSIATSAENDHAALTAFVVESGVASSLVEGLAFPVLTGGEAPGVCTVSAINEAFRQGIEVVQLQPSNAERVLPRLQIDAAAVDEMRSELASGRVVVTPVKNITFKGWTGCAYAVIDPHSGAGGYMISGGLHGTAFALSAVGGLLASALLLAVPNATLSGILGVVNVAAWVALAMAATSWLNTTSLSEERKTYWRSRYAMSCGAMGFLSFYCSTAGYYAAANGDMETAGACVVFPPLLQSVFLGLMLSEWPHQIEMEMGRVPE